MTFKPVTEGPRPVGEKDRAFLEALDELYAMYPVPGNFRDPKKRKGMAQCVNIRKNIKGYACRSRRVLPLGDAISEAEFYFHMPNAYWRDIVTTHLPKAARLPPKQFVTIVTLIYG